MTKIEKMRAIIPRGVWLDLGYDETTGAPIVSTDIQRVRMAFRSDVEQLIEWLQLALEEYPSEATVAHSLHQFCGDAVCVECYERERNRGRYFQHLWESVGDVPKDGYVVLYMVRGKYRLFSSAKPEQRLRAIERELSESVTFVHRIETNDHLYLKCLWHAVLRDYYEPTLNGFDLPARALNVFKNKQEQFFERSQPFDEKMTDVELDNPSNLLSVMRRYLSQGYLIDSTSLARLQEAEAKTAGEKNEI